MDVAGFQLNAHTGAVNSCRLHEIDTAPSISCMVFCRILTQIIILMWTDGQQRAQHDVFVRDTDQR